ncbi:MAG: MFS transporter [Pseudonocardiales bacterium]
MPIYPLYALLFADRGLSDGQISALLAIWSSVGILAEVPTGVLADHFSRRSALVVAGVLQAGGYTLWALAPGFLGFAGGFALWGLGGALASGAREALVYDGLAALGAEDHYARLSGRIMSAGLLGQLPAAAAATVLYAAGGFALATWVSAGLCLAAAVLATRLPEAPRQRDAEDDEPTYLAGLRAGVAVIARRPGVRHAALAVAILNGFDALDEYFPLIARDWGVPTGLNPLATLAIPLVGAVGAALGGPAARLRSATLAGWLGSGAIILGAASLWRRPGGLAAVAVFYGVYRLVLVVVDARLQERITSASRATVTSVAGLGSEVSAFGLYAAWAWGGIGLVAAVVLGAAFALPRLIRRPVSAAAAAR